jgi:predicted Zn finger-like uncharacterized protein
MIITCPNCSTRFLIDPKALGAKGRTVRCRSCEHRWHQAPAEDAAQPAGAERAAAQPATTEAATTGAAPAAPIPPPPTASGRARERGGSAALVGWLAVALVVLLLAGAVVGRNEVVASFPQTAEVYRKLGLPVSTRLGLEFREVTSARLVEGGVSVLVVEGEILNVGRAAREVPPVRLALLDDGRREIEHSVHRPEIDRLDSGGRASFAIRMVGPPDEARTFSVTFDTGN